MGKKHITAQRVEGLHGVSVCRVCLSACVCGRRGRYALNSSAERRETQEPVNNSSNSILFLHDCSPALPSSTSEYNSRMWRRTCQKLLVRNKVWPVRCRRVRLFVYVRVTEHTHMYVCRSCFFIFIFKIRYLYYIDIWTRFCWAVFISASKLRNRT